MFLTAFSWSLKLDIIVLELFVILLLFHFLFELIDPGRIKDSELIPKWEVLRLQDNRCLLSRLLIHITLLEYVWLPNTCSLLVVYWANVNNWLIGSNSCIVVFQHLFLFVLFWTPFGRRILDRWWNAPFSRVVLRITCRVLICIDYFLSTIHVFQFFHLEQRWILFENWLLINVWNAFLPLWCTKLRHWDRLIRRCLILSFLHKHSLS